MHFYSHAPYGTWRGLIQHWQACKDFYSHAPYGTWPSVRCDEKMKTWISTHTPLTGRDCQRGFSLYLWITFLLTRPLRDVTLWLLYTHVCICNFYSHAPYGTWLIWMWQLILITPFLLTRPLRDVTVVPVHTYQQCTISTHTPLTGRDVRVVHTLIARIISTHTPLTGRDVSW